MNQLIAVVGMSGSGKSIATDYLEEAGWTKLYFGGITYRLRERLMEKVRKNFGRNLDKSMDLNVMLSFWKTILKSL